MSPKLRIKKAMGPSSETLSKSQKAHRHLVCCLTLRFPSRFECTFHTCVEFLAPEVPQLALSCVQYQYEEKPRSQTLAGLEVQHDGLLWHWHAPPC